MKITKKMVNRKLNGLLEKFWKNNKKRILNEIDSEISINKSNKKDILYMDLTKLFSKISIYTCVSNTLVGETKKRFDTLLFQRLEKELIREKYICRLKKPYTMEIILNKKHMSLKNKFIFLFKYYI